MTDRYVDSTTGSDLDDGSTPALAWATVEHALESGNLSSGYNVWVRRIHGELPTTDIDCMYDGAADSPIQVIGWPRNEEGAGSGTWANGSTEINDVSGLEMDREKHVGRRIKQDTNDEWYLITYIPYIRQDAGAIKIAFVDSNPDTITDTDARFIKRNIKAGDKIRITGSTTNNGTYTIATVVAGTITLVGGDTLTAEDAIDGTKIQVYDRFIIDREYAGTDTGNFTTQKDDDYNSRPQAGIDAGWDSDTHDLPTIDFNDGAFNLEVSIDSYHIFKNLEIKDSSNPSGIINYFASGASSLIGCLIKQSVQNYSLVKVDNQLLYCERVIFEGSGAGANQRGIYKNYDQCTHLKDCALYNLGDSGLYLYHTSLMTFLENVNIGVEISNGDDDIYLAKRNKIRGRDVKLGGENGDVSIIAGLGYGLKSTVQFENYGKILNAHKTWFEGGVVEKAAVSGETPDKKLSDDVIKITPDVTDHKCIEDWAFEIFCHEFEVDTATRTWKYWIFNNAMGTINDTTATDDLWLKLEYVEERDDDTEYIIKEAYSTEIDILNAANASDWDYLQVSSITPAVASKVRVKCFLSDYSATGCIYIDPKVVNP